MVHDKKVADYIHDNQDRFVKDIVRLAAQPSVSARKEGIAECAVIVKTMIEEIGGTARMLKLPGAAPLVYGELKSSKSNKTILFYNHYDVQPEDPLELWKSPPFKPEVRDGRLYGRGVSDDKGQLVSRLKLIESYVKVNGEPPCNVKFCFEGEEEVGSRHLDEYVDKNPDLFKSDAVIWEYGKIRQRRQAGRRPRREGDDLPRAHRQVALAGRAQHVRGRPPERRLEAHEAPQPDQGLAREDPHPRMVRQGPGPRRGRAQAPRGAALRGGGAPRHLRQPRSSQEGCRSPQAKKSLVARPDREHRGHLGGLHGPGSKTVLPAEAHCKMDFRLVPDQDPEELFAKFVAFLKENGYGDVEIAKETMEPAARTSYKSDLGAGRDQGGEGGLPEGPVIEISSAGTGPLYVFTRRYGVAALDIGISPVDAALHSPNENIRLDFLEKGMLWLGQTIENFLGQVTTPRDRLCMRDQKSKRKNG